MPREVLGSFIVDEKQEIVLCHVSGFQPFVTWFHTIGAEDYYSGRYFKDKSEAAKDFLDRCKAAIR